MKMKKTILKLTFSPLVCGGCGESTNYMENKIKTKKKKSPEQPLSRQ